MPSLAMSVPHQLPPEEALRRIQNLLADLKQQYGDQVKDLTESWSGNDGQFSLTAMNMRISGTLSVHPHEVTLNGNIPFAAVPFRSQIQQLIRERAEALLA
jgi:hypothetical protein